MDIIDESVRRIVDGLSGDPRTVRDNDDGSSL